MSKTMLFSSTALLSFLVLLPTVGNAHIRTFQGEACQPVTYTSTPNDGYNCGLTVGDDFGVPVAAYYDFFTSGAVSVYLIKYSYTGTEYEDYLTVTNLAEGAHDVRLAATTTVAVNSSWDYYRGFVSAVGTFYGMTLVN
jgi:hypothetical protein